MVYDWISDWEYGAGIPKVGIRELLFGVEPKTYFRRVLYKALDVSSNRGFAGTIAKTLALYVKENDQAAKKSLEDTVFIIKPYRPIIENKAPVVMIDALEILTVPRHERTDYLISVLKKNQEFYSDLDNFPLIKNVLGASHLIELVEPLQSLADIIAYEARQAFISDYYPPLNKWDLEPEFVEKVLHAMQQELNREGSSRGITPIKYTDLPYERQYALVERRRYWYYFYGITYDEWSQKRFSIWKVPDEVIPDDVYTALKDFTFIYDFDL
jgi:hypothetical protein